MSDLSSDAWLAAQQPIDLDECSWTPQIFRDSAPPNYKDTIDVWISTCQKCGIRIEEQVKSGEPFKHNQLCENCDGFQMREEVIYVDD